MRGIAAVAPHLAERVRAEAVEAAIRRIAPEKEQRRGDRFVALSPVVSGALFDEAFGIARAIRFKGSLVKALAALVPTAPVRLRPEMVVNACRELATLSGDDVAVPAAALCAKLGEPEGDPALDSALRALTRRSDEDVTNALGRGHGRARRVALDRGVVSASRGSCHQTGHGCSAARRPCTCTPAICACTSA